MNSKLVAKITTKRTDGGTRTGTGFPLGAKLLLTARHVIEFDERDKTKPITVDWQDVGKSVVIEPKDIAFAYDGKEYDVVLLCCPVPDAIAVDIPHAILETEKIISRNAWETLGFPKVNDFKAKDATGTFGVDLEKPQISLTLDDTIDKEILKANNIEHGWGGMSGAPVFCINTKKLQAIITDHNQWMQKQLIGTSIPYLMKLPEFRKALGLNDADEQHQKYLAGLPHRITKQLRQIEKNRLYQTLASEFISGGIEKSPENLWQAIEDKINSEPLNLLEQYRKTVERVLKEEPKQINEAQTLFLMFLGFFSEPEDIATAVHQVHQLSVKTRLAVEIYLAARYGLTPDLVYEPGVGIDVNQFARGRFAIDGENEFREVGWDVKANAKELIKMTNIAINKVHESVHGQKPTDDLDDFALESLNETIKTRRQGEYPQLIRVEVPFKKTSEQNHPLHNDDVCATLFELLPSLPIVRYGSGSAKIEPKLCAQVNEFFRIIKQYSQDT
jgi:hypothetical protein